MSNLLSRATEGYLCKNTQRSLLSTATEGYLGCGIFVPATNTGGRYHYNTVPERDRERQRQMVEDMMIVNILENWIKWLQ